ERVVACSGSAAADRHPSETAGEAAAARHELAGRAVSGPIRGDCARSWKAGRMSEHVGQIASVMAGLAVLLAVAGYAVTLERRRLEDRLQAFVGSGMVTARPKTTPALRPRRRSRIMPIFRRLRLGAHPRQLSQAGVTVTPRHFAMLQL